MASLPRVTDRSGRNVFPGVYFVRRDDGSTHAAGKIVVVN